MGSWRLVPPLAPSRPSPFPALRRAEPSPALPCLDSGSLPLCLCAQPSPGAIILCYPRSYFCATRQPTHAPASHFSHLIPSYLTSPHLVSAHSSLLYLTSTHSTSHQVAHRHIVSIVLAHLGDQLALRPESNNCFSRDCGAQAHLNPTLPVGAPWSLNPPQKLSISPPIRWKSTLRTPVWTGSDRITFSAFLRHRSFGH